MNKWSVFTTVALEVESTTILKHGDFLFGWKTPTKKKQVKFVNQPKKWFLDSSGASFNSTIPKIDVELMDADREPTAYPKLVNHTGDEFDRKWPENKPLLGVVFFCVLGKFQVETC